MIVISSEKLRINMKKYLDLTTEDPVIIKRGKEETFVLSKQEPVSSIDISRAITKEELVKRIKFDIKEMYAKGKGESSVPT